MIAALQTLRCGCGCSLRPLSDAMARYYEYVGLVGSPLLQLDEAKVPRVVIECTETKDSFIAETLQAIENWVKANPGKFNVGSGPMNIRPILKWNDDGDHMVRVYGLRRYVWSS